VEQSDRVHAARTGDVPELNEDCPILAQVVSAARDELTEGAELWIEPGDVVPDRRASVRPRDVEHDDVERRCKARLLNSTDHASSCLPTIGPEQRQNTSSIGS
jgi:hypothetical protein